MFSGTQFAEKRILEPKSYSIYQDYIITDEICGQGANGRVLICVHRQTQKRFALKRLEECKKVRREIDLHWRLSQDCPNIVKIIDVYENTIDGKRMHLLVLECMEGGELFAQITKRKNNYTEQEVAKIMSQICTAVHHIHSMNVAHRDLKPENLLLTTKDESGIIKLTDFGFAKEVNSGLMTPCFTPYYVAPEILSKTEYDISCDIWSLGVIMYILCCGYPPFYSNDGQPISPGMRQRITDGEYEFPDDEWSRISEDAKNLIRFMLETNPEKRATIKDVVQSNWISNYMVVPRTPITGVFTLTENSDEIRQHFEILDEMRNINSDKIPNLKDISDVTVNFLQKRNKKKRDKGNST